MKKIVLLLIVMTWSIMSFALLPDANIEKAPSLRFGTFYVFPEVSGTLKLGKNASFDLGGMYFYNNVYVAYTRLNLNMVRSKDEKTNIIFSIGADYMKYQEETQTDYNWIYKNGYWTYTRETKVEDKILITPELSIIHQTDFNENFSIKNAIGFPWVITNEFLWKFSDRFRIETGLFFIYPYFNATITF